MVVRFFSQTINITMDYEQQIYKTFCSNPKIKLIY